MPSSGSEPEFDALVIGAGLSGLYQLYRLRELGLTVACLEAGDGVGGTWYWNRYPGARCDSQSTVYQYWFSKELLDEWQWSERFASQPEVLRYLNHVAERFDLLRDITFGVRVQSATFDESTSAWTVVSDDGETRTARFLISAVGALTEPQLPDIAGIGEFGGTIHHTSRWPKEGVDLGGKRVAVIGTGATGIQVIQEAAKQAAALTVFQRTANFAIPMNNPKNGPADWQRLRERCDETRKRAYETMGGFDFDAGTKLAAEFSEAERRALLEELWAEGSLRFWIGAFADTMVDPAANRIVADFVREKIRERVKDPAVAEMLMPNDHHFGTRRVPLENGYFEVFNQDNVRLVDLKATPIERFTARGIATTKEHFDLDVVVLATGFDAVTGALLAMEIRGTDGQTLREAWADGPAAYLALQAAGFPNLFFLTGPTAPSVAFCNYPTCAQWQVDWVTDTIADLRRQGRTRIEADPEAQERWMNHVDELTATTLVAQTDSWWMGSNVKGKRRRLLTYLGGAPTYHQACRDAVRDDYEGFRIA